MKPQDRTRAILRSGLPTSDRFVLIAIADYCSREGRCWPSAVSLALDTGMNERSVRRAMKRLEGKGLVTTKRKGQVSLLEVVTEALPPRENPGHSVRGSAKATPDSESRTPDSDDRTPDSESRNPGHSVRRREQEGTNTEGTNGRGSSSEGTREDVKALISVREELHQSVLRFAPGERFGSELPKLTQRISQEIREHHSTLNLIDALTALGRWAYLSPDASWAHSAGEPLKAILGGETSTRMRRVDEAMVWRAANEPRRKGWQSSRGNSRRGQSTNRQSFAQMVPRDAGSNEEIPFGDWTPAQDGQ